ncbi:sensor histidine kinase [Capnocytophaga leadbetteri]|jgi:signal transduction histidine kinase, lytS|uniref:sensor histidine kinase n=1 Tax=Capnocytophaga leadbetteri TaxID=327575 RepID=UPI0028D506A6|nr:histidine kinase [Capnocytophaga leadbetteri]
MKTLTHIASWAVVFIMPALIFISEGNQRFEEALYRSLASLPFLMFLFYSYYYWLIDKLWFKKRYILFILVAVTLILCVSYSKYELFSYFALHKRKHKMPPFHAFVYFDFLSNLLPVVFAMAIRYAQRNFSLEIAQKEVKAQKLQADLTQLRYQLQPHFFFNALNNIYSLIEFDPQKAQQSVHSLSKLMRHFMQNSDQKQISLAEEVDFLQQYISLMQLRLTDKTTVQVDFPKQVPQLTIAPLLFISLVENAFKHGVSATTTTTLSFSLRVEGDTIIFRSENTKIPTQESLYSSGIGIDNLKKRLTLLYPERHQYTIEEKEGKYIAQLTIDN